MTGRLGEAPLGGVLVPLAGAAFTFLALAGAAMRCAAGVGSMW